MLTSPIKTKTSPRSRTLRGALAGLVAGALVVLATAGPAAAAPVARGTAKTFSVNSSGSVNFATPVLTRDWSAGWTSEATYTIGAKRFLFKNKQGNGHVKVRQLNDNGTIAGAELQDEYLETGWTNVAAVRDGNGSQYVLFYNRATGLVRLRNILADGRVLGGDPSGVSYVAAGFTSVQAYANYALFVNATTGATANVKINVPSCTTCSHTLPTEYRNIGAGWTSATTMVKHARVFVLLMNATNGKARTDELDPVAGKFLKTGIATTVTQGFTTATHYTTLQKWTPPGGGTPINVVKGQFVLLYNKTTGRAEVRTLTETMGLASSIQTTTIESGWTFAGAWTPPTSLNPYLVLVAG